MIMLYLYRTYHIPEPWRLFYLLLHGRDEEARRYMVASGMDTSRVGWTELNISVQALLDVYAILLIVWNAMTRPRLQQQKLLQILEHDGLGWIIVCCLSLFAAYPDVWILWSSRGVSIQAVFHIIYNQVLNYAVFRILSIIFCFTSNVRL